MAFDDYTTPDAIRAWLAAQPPRAIVGERHDPCGCPLACYLREHDDPRWFVGTKTANCGSLDVDLPSWAQRFVGLIDHAGSRRRVRADEALAALDAALHSE